MKRNHERSNPQNVRNNNVPKYLTYDKTSNTYRHNENTLLVKRIVREYLAGSSLYSITKRFNDEGIKTFRRGFEWHPKSVSCILKNPVLIGEFLGNKKFCAPIVDKTDFDKLQTMLAKNQWKVSGRENENLVNILRGLAFCKDCGRRVHLAHQSVVRGKPIEIPYRYLRCATSSAGQKCSGRSYINATDFEVELFIEFLMSDPRKLTDKADTSQLKSVQSTIAKHETNIQLYTKTINNLLDLESAAPSDIKPRLIKLNKERDKEKTALDAANLELLRTQQKPFELEYLREFQKEYRLMDMGEADFKYEHAVRRMKELLRDNEIRLKLRTVLPRIIGRVVVDFVNGGFEVLNHRGQVVYQSMDLELAQ